MNSLLVIALFATVAFAAQEANHELTEEHKAHHDDIKHSTLEKLSPEAHAAGKKIHEIFEAAHKEAHALLESLPEKVREELKALKKEHHHHKKQFTEEEKEAFHKHLDEKLSDEAKAAAKKIHEIREEHKQDHKAAEEAIEKELESLPEKVREELKSLHHIGKHSEHHTRGERHHSTTPAH